MDEANAAIIEGRYTQGTPSPPKSDNPLGVRSLTMSGSCRSPWMGAPLIVDGRSSRLLDGDLERYLTYLSGSLLLVLERRSRLRDLEYLLPPFELLLHWLGIISALYGIIVW